MIDCCIFQPEVQMFNIVSLPVRHSVSHSSHNHTYALLGINIELLYRCTNEGQTFTTHTVIYAPDFYLLNNYCFTLFLF